MAVTVICIIFPSYLCDITDITLIANPSHKIDVKINKNKNEKEEIKFTVFNSDTYIYTGLHRVSILY